MSVPTEIAATVQSASIHRYPDPVHDSTPATVAERRIPVSLSSAKSLDSDEDFEDDIPYSVLRPIPRGTDLPPLPDLRFEQSYLKSISNADTWWKVLLITARDQVMMPLAQGVIYNLLVCGWQHWNANARMHGNTAGARVRRWWYRVNKWNIPDRRKVL